MTWKLQLGNGAIDASSAPLVMGILNVTPDSFSDGGEFLEPDRAVDRATEMAAQGAEIIDVGPESTRPGSRPVAAAEQIARAVRVIEGIRHRHDSLPISIDTRLAPVAMAALDAGADLINDVSALRDDPGMARLAADRGTPIVLMHRRGTPATMQEGGGPHYDDVIGEIRAFLLERARFAIESGIDRSRIILDPGIGFGKRVEHNLAILRHLGTFVALGFPVLLGASRKRFLGTTENAMSVAEHAPPGDSPTAPTIPGKPMIAGVEGRLGAGARVAGSLACAAIATMAGAAILRVHDVPETCAVVRLCEAVRSAAD